MGQAQADYYNNALNTANRTTPQATMKQAIIDGKTVGSLVTSVKNQGDSGTCWAFSTASVVETSLMKQLQNAGITPTLDQFDISEKYDSWMMYALAKSEIGKTNPHAFFKPSMETNKETLKAYPTMEPNRTFFSNISQGGNISHQLSSLMGGFLVEEGPGKPDLTFYPLKADVLKNQVSSVVTTPTYKARDVYFDTAGTEKIGISTSSQLSQLQKYKDLIQKTGSIRVNYTAGGTTTDHASGAIYDSVANDINHAIVVVGYNDDYDFSGSKLAIKPTEKGAWIVKNSWGAVDANNDPNGDAGYYYMSYYDKTATFDYATVIEPDLARYSITDNHTPLYIEKEQYNVQATPTYASKYTATENQFLKAVSFLTNSNGASYKIDVLTSAENLDSKPIYTQSGTFSGDRQLSGFHTVDLDKFILVPKNNDYLVRITITGASGAKEYLNVSISNSKNYPTLNLTFKDEESFFKSSSGEWADAKKEVNGAVILNGQSKETSSANGGDFTVASLRTNKNSNVIINLGKANELYLTDIIHPDRKTLSNMTADINNVGSIKVNEDFYGTITGEGGVTKTGTGELSFQKNNTYTGHTNVDQGTLSNYKSIDSNVDVKSGAKYKIINNIKQTTTNQRGINNEGTVLIAADNKGTIKFANIADILKSSIAGKWYFNTLDETAKRRATNGTIIIDADTDEVKGNLYIQGGNIQLSSGQKKFFTNPLAIKTLGDGVNVSAKTQLVKGNSQNRSMSGSNSSIADLELGKVVIEGTTKINVDVAFDETELVADLIKGTSIKGDGSNDDTINKVILGFTLDQDVTFTDAINGVSTIVEEGQLGVAVHDSAFAIDRQGAIGSYNISYLYDAGAQNGTLKIVNATAPTSLQDAITSAVTSKYYTLGTNQILTNSWDANLNGNDLTLVGNNIIIDGDTKTQVFNIAKDKMLTISDLTVKQGIGTAIHNEGTLAVNSVNSEVKLTQNDGANGGAIYNKEDLTLLTSGNNIQIQDNTATNGAGIYNDADALGKSPTVDASTILGDIVFDNNTASTEGGAIYNKGDVLLWADGGNIKLNNNKAQSGAGIFNTGYLSIYTTDKSAEFSKNIAAVNGGAIANDGGNVEILAHGGSVNFSQNEATNGGAIYNTNTVGAVGPVVVDIIAEEGNITFNGNIASTNGGAIYNTETVNILALDDKNVAFKQSTDKIYNTGTINLNYNADYGVTNGLIAIGARLGGTGTYNLYGGELAFVKATNNLNVLGSISHDSTLSVLNDATLNLANGIKEIFNPGTLNIADKSALFVAIDCILNGTSSEGDFLDAGTYSGGSTSQIIIAAVNLIKNNDNKASYRINIADSTLKAVIAENLWADITGFRSAYSSQTGDILLLSTAVKGLIDYVESTDSTRTYSMTEEESVIFPLGTLGGDNSTLTIDGNNNKIISEFSDIDGITVSGTNTLNVKNVTFKNFETAITNKAFLNLDNVIFDGQVGPSFYDVNNSARMTANNFVSGKILNSGLFTAGKTNDLSALSLRTVDGSIIDLRTTTNNVNFGSLAIAGKVDLYLNGVNRLDSSAFSTDAGTDSLTITSIKELKSVSTAVTTTDDIKPFIKIADDIIFSLTDAAKPSAANAYKLTYSAGNVLVNSVDLGDTSTKSGSYNIGNSTDFVASDSMSNNTIASGTTVTLDGAKSGIELNLPSDMTVSGTGIFNSLTLNGSKFIVEDSTTAKLEVIDSTVNNELKLNGGATEIKNSTINGEINMADASTLSFTRGVNTVNGAIVGQVGASVVINAPTTFNNTVDPVTETINSLAIHKANVSQVDFEINTGGELAFTKDSYLSNDHTNTLNFDGGTLNLMNGTASTIMLQGLNTAASTESVSISSLYVDVDLANKTMDKLNATSVDVGSGSILNVAGMRLLSDAKEDNTLINFTENTSLKGILMTSVTSAAYSPIYKYLVDYNSTSGNFGFTRSLNPAIMASSVAAQIGSYLTQINTYEQAFGNMDMMMSMTTEQRQAMKFANKYAAAGAGANLVTFSPNQIPEQDAGGWFRPYTTFENVGLNNGPTVGNIAYGSLFGGDTEIKELKNGWDAVYTGYAGYNGSQQNYDGISINQSGATLGATGVFYKGNLFTGLTANVGANAAQAYTMYGKEDFTMLTSGIASKTGYNFELNNGKFIIQPNYLMSYSFVNTFNYTNAAGVNMSSDPLNAIQVSPGIKFIGNLENGWQPYAVVQMVWNIMDQTKFQANDVSLPELSVKPYIQYGIGIQRRWGDRFTGYGQAMIRNGGRNGIALQFGFRFALGKAPSKTIGSAVKAPKSANAEPKKCNISLQSLKSNEKILKKG